MTKITYDKIGQDYNSTRKADPIITNRLISFLAPKTGLKYLDIGCGTGNYTIGLANFGINICGVDPSEKMLNVARSLDTNIRWEIGRAEKTSFENDVFDGITGVLTLHHWLNLEESFRELNRVLKEKGIIVLFTATPEQMEGYWLNHYFPKMMERSISQMPSLERVNQFLENTPLKIIQNEKYYIHDQLQDKFLYVGKNNPALYLDEKIRTGISSFSNLANQDEVNEGLMKLSNDIANGRVKEIMKSYDNDRGDYMFIKIQKDTNR